MIFGHHRTNNQMSRRQAGVFAAVILMTTAVALGVHATPSKSAPLDCGVTTDSTPAPPLCQQGFVTQSGTQLMLNGSPFKFVGINIYNANNLGDCWYALNADPLLVDSLNAIPTGSVVRAWFFQPFAPTDGVRDWSAFDKTLQLAAARGIRVVATLANQWADCDGPNGSAGDKKLDTWFADGYRTTVHPGGTVDYRSWAAEVAARYSGDPTILAWQLMNEAEIIHRDGTGVESCPAGAATTLRDFAADVSGAIKQVDPNHLISLGTIGTGQCGAQGAEYTFVHDVSTIDLCEYHDYGSPTTPIPGDQYNGLAVRIDQCNSLGKPLFIGEVGIDPSATGASLEGRAAAFSAKRDAQFGSGVVGLLAWALDTDWSTLNDFDISPRDPLLATFEGAVPPPASQTLHVSVQGSGRGTVSRRPGGPGCSGNCIAEVDEGATVTITAQPQGGSQFVGWGGPDAAPCIAMSCTMTMDVARGVTANFADVMPPTATITSPGDGATYPLLTGVTAAYACTDNVAIASCAGPVPVGSPLPANAPGSTPFTVSANDLSGLNSTLTATYTVSNTLADGLGLTGSFTSVPTSVSVADVAEPFGVTVSVPGGAAGPVVMDVCGGFTIELVPGTVATLTCGSVIVSVTSGQVKVTTPDGTAWMTVPSGGAASLSTGGVPLNLGAVPIVFVGPMTRIAVSPAVAVVGVGVAQLFTVEAFDAYGQSLGDSTGAATFTITPSATCTANSCKATTVGVRTVTAQVGTLSATAVLDVRKAQTIKFTAPTTKVMTQSPVALTATATSGLPVSFVSTTPNVCTTTGPNGASAVLVAVGTCSVTARQSGDSTWAAAPDVVRTFTINLATQTITFAPLPARTIDQTPITVAATASSGLQVVFSTTSPAVCSATGPSGSSIVLLAAGTCTVRADQAGDPVYAAAPPVTRNFTVSKLANTITFSSLTRKTLAESPVVVTATASSGLPVTFTSTTTAVCTVGGVNGSTIALVAAGTCTIRADQAGNATYKPATPVSRSFTVTRVAQTITFATLSNKTRAQSPVIVTATASSGLPVQFTTTTPLICTNGGTNGSVITLLATGTCTVRADQSGDAYWATAPAVSRSFKVT